MKKKSDTRTSRPGVAKPETVERPPNSGGQAGDTQGISTAEDVDSESVDELVEEGQSFEASVISGIENAPTPDVSEVRTREVPVDDVPPEYLDQDRLDR
ncbi:MAG TPA: hypothetical protein VFA65_12275 [Bryobacteraceae bacterium]|nr:hypothetical protein [Bryobacteraceae bacterium]